MVNDILLVVMDVIGTVAFSVSGTLVAISCGLDLFGVLTVGCITAMGGGIIRDIILGNIPPSIFFNPPILLVAAGTSLAVFILADFNTKRFQGLRQKIDTINIFFDALGLASFSLTGVEVAVNSGFADNILLVITSGVLSGVGGGILRDVLVNEKPYVLTKHIYAVASIAGCGIYYFFSILQHDKITGTIAIVTFILTIRMLAAKFHWKLPKVKLEHSENA